MTLRQKLEVKASEQRAKLNELSHSDTELSTEQRAELDKVSKEYQDTEARLRAVILTEGAEEGAAGAGDGTEQRAAGGDEQRAAGGADDAETRQLNELADKVELRRYLAFAASDKQPDGAERELVQALGLEGAGAGVVVPWQALDPGLDEEHRQDVATVAPAEVTRTQAAIVGRVFARSSAAWCGVMMPAVGVGQREFPVVTAGTTATTEAKAAAVDAAAATFTVKAATPRRLTARYLFSIEDLAVFSGMEEALRMDLGGTMSEELDKALLVGDGTSPNVAGLFDTDSGIAAPSAAAAEATVDTYIGAVTDQVDGRYANTGSTVRLLTGAPTYRHMAGKFITGTDTSALRHVESISAGVRVSAHVPGVVAKKQELLAVRGGGYAVAPMWPAVSMIRDPYSAAAKGQISLTVVILYGFVVARADGFKRVSIQVEA